jgi:hypothetical protein
MMRRCLSRLIYGVVMLLLVADGQAAAQKVLTLKAVGNGERVQLALHGRTRRVRLAEDFAGDFVAGGQPPHHYKTLLSVQRGAAFYLVARVVSRSPISNPNAPCGGDRPLTLLLVKADQRLRVEKVQTEIYNSCAYNGTGRELTDRPQITNSSISIRFTEGAQQYLLSFDADAAEPGLQLHKH